MDASARYSATHMFASQYGASVDEVMRSGLTPEQLGAERFVPDASLVEDPDGLHVEPSTLEPLVGATCIGGGWCSVHKKQGAFASRTKAACV